MKYSKRARNRGEDFSEPRSAVPYDYRPENQYTDRAQERAPRRHEIRDSYVAFYDLEQRRNQRSFQRTADMANEFFAGVDPRRKQELADGGMIREDHRAMANLPRMAIHCEYPRSQYYTTPYLDDTIRGTDEERDDNNSSMVRYLNPYQPDPSY